MCIRDRSEAESGAYEVFNPKSGQVLAGHYVVGWARKASEGLVGTARMDAERGANHVLAYLEQVAAAATPSAQEIRALLERKGRPVVGKQELVYLGRAEEKQARERGLASFKFAEDAVMLEAIEEEMRKPASMPAASG